MSDHEFLFALRLSKDDRLDDMVRALAAAVLEHVGCAPDAAAALGDELRAGVHRAAAADGECLVRFHAHDGAIDVSLRQGDRRIVDASRRLT